MMETYDLLIVGGGINGAGIARDAAGRGLTVLLCEQGDLAGATSSASSKLIHGGLRYLEQYEFRLVREALAEREVLLRSAPTSSGRCASCCRTKPALRPRWLVRLGLFLYDHIGGKRSLPGTERIALRSHRFGAPAEADRRRRLRLLRLLGRRRARWWCSTPARPPRKRDHRDPHRLTGARRDGESWIGTLRDLRTGSERPVRARALVNAAGPGWWT